MLPLSVPLRKPWTHISAQKLIDWCAENARMPAHEYWDNLGIPAEALPT